MGKLSWSVLVVFATVMLASTTHGNLLGMPPVPGLTYVLVAQAEKYPILGTIEPFLVSFVQNLYNAMNNISLVIQILNNNVKCIVGCNLSLLLSTMTEIYSGIIFYVNVLLSLGGAECSSGGYHSEGLIEISEKVSAFLKDVPDSDDKILGGIIEAVKQLGH